MHLNGVIDPVLYICDQAPPQLFVHEVVVSWMEESFIFHCNPM